MTVKTISHYLILDKLGEGGMGVVYKAEDTKLKREVAIKFLPPQIAASEEDRERFKIEAQAAAALNHPNIATIYTVEEVDGESFIVMEYIEGQELKKIVGTGGRSLLPIETILDYAAQISEGLQAAHEKGVIHRDIKSANIMITKEGRVKIMDFGLAKVHAGAGLTAEHSTLGTAAYMSPEQALGEQIDHRTDIWSFGVVLYEMLSRQLPFKGKCDTAIIQSILSNKPESIADKREDVPSEIEQITYKCLQKDKEHRYQTFDELLNDLKKTPIALASGKSTSQTKKVPKNHQKRKTVFGIVAAVIVIVLLAIIAASIFREKSKNSQIVNTRSLITSTTVMLTTPQISPDGTRVAYTSTQSGNLDIWVQQLASGQQLNLTEDYKGIDVGMTWSPDGEWLAFESTRDGGGIFVISAYGGNVRQLLSHPAEDIGCISWAPDGKNLAYNLNGKVYSIPAQGGKPKEIDLPHLVRFGPTWSPDSERLTYGAGDKIWSIGLNGSRPTAVVDKKGKYYSPPIWSHDGKRIYFKWQRGEIRDIWWIKVDELGRPKDSVRPLTSGRNISSFSFSNDGRKLAYVTVGYQHNIYSLPSTKDGVLSLDDAQQITYEKWYINPLSNFLAMSPDFDRISFIVQRGANYQIHVVDKDGKNLRSVTADSSDKWVARWAPDGEHIVFAGDGHIYTISTKGGPATPIVSDLAWDMYPACSPDGNQVVFASKRSGNTDLWVMPFNGGTRQQLTSDEAEEYEPIWSPAADMISFGSNRSGAHEIYLLQVESRTIRRLTTINSPNYIGHDWSPDGKKIYISYQPKPGEFSRNICEVTVRDNTMRTLLESKNLTLQNSLQRAIASDGENVYFIKENYADTYWIADVIYE